MSSCSLCTKTFRDLGRLNRHMVSHTKEKPHKCLMCPAAFGTTDHLKTHIKRIHEGIKNKKCPLCSHKCYNNTMLQKHLRKHSAEKPFSCSVLDCDFKTKYKENLDKHSSAVHSSARPYECPSDGCTFKAKSNSSLKRHLLSHSNDTPFTCKFPGCSYKYKKKGDLTCHTSRPHSDGKTFQCSTCDFRAKHKTQLNEHQLSRHTQIKRFQCEAPNCGFASYRKSSLDVHLDRKHRKKDVICTEPRCNFRCSTTALLKAHLNRHEKPLLKCPGDSCKFTTRYRTGLLRHLSREHEDENSTTMAQRKKVDLQIAETADKIETLHCNFPNCGYQTKFPHRYDRHRITHNKEENREHVCSFCFFRFSTVRALRLHIQRHTGEKPYNCSHCKFSTVDNFYLRKHAVRAHNILVVPTGEEDDVMRKCRTCSKTFCSNSELVLHSMSHLQTIMVLQQLKLQTL